MTAAAELIAAEGFGAASFARIAARAGYSRGLAGQKFGSKDALVRAVINLVAARVEALFQARVARAQTPVDEVITFVDSFLGHLESDRLVRSYFIMMAAAIANRLPIAQAFVEAHDGVKARLREMVARGQASGQISASLDADATALSIGALLLGISVQLLLDPDLDMTALHAAALGAVAAELAG